MSFRRQDILKRIAEAIGKPCDQLSVSDSLGAHAEQLRQTLLKEFNIALPNTPKTVGDVFRELDF